MTLDDRKAAILRAVVSEYIESAQPVGSAHVARSSGVDVSSATVRNEMTALETEGYLEQPHTSAGRVPTERGYRFFVDSLAGPGPLGTADRRQVSAFFAQAHGELEGMLDDTSRLLSNLTDYAALVVAPPHEHATVRSVQLVGLADRTCLLVVVLSDGSVEKHTIESDDPVDEVTLTAAARGLSSALVGVAIGDLPAAVSTTDNEATNVLVAAALSELQPGPGDGDAVYVGGASRMATSFEAVEQVKAVLTILEQQLVVVSLLRDVVDRGLNVAIGTETGIQPLADCALVVTPYEVDGEQVGAIGVLGPARMDYPRALAAVAVVGNRLSDHLREG